MGLFQDYRFFFEFMYREVEATSNAEDKVYMSSALDGKIG